MCPHLSSGASKESHNTATVSNQLVQAIALLFLLSLPLLQRRQQRGATQNNVKVKS